MGWVYLSVNAIFAALFSVLAKVSSSLSKGRILGALYFAFLVAVAEIIIFSALNGFRLQFTLTSFWFALAYGFAGILGTVVSLKAYSLGNMAAYAVISTSGSIVIPFLFGVIALNETAGICKWIGCILVVIGVVVLNCGRRPQDEQARKSGLVFVLLCIAGALVSGAAQCINKLQAVTQGTIDGNSYVVLVQGCIFVYCLITAACLPKKTAALFREVPALHGGKRCLVAGLYGLVGGLNIVVTLLTNEYLSSVIVFPVLNGLTIVLTMLAGRVFFKEKLTRRNVISAAVIIVAIAVTVLPY